MQSSFSCSIILSVTISSPSFERSSHESMHESLTLDSTGRACLHASYDVNMTDHLSRICAVEPSYLEAVVVLPERHALVPGVHDGDAQPLYDRQRQAIAPAAPHNHPHRRVVALQRVVPQQAHAGQRLAAEAFVV